MSPRWGVLRGAGVPGLYPFDAPRTGAWSTLDHQHGPDASIVFDVSQKTLEILGTQQMTQGVLPLHLPSWQQVTSWSRERHDQETRAPTPPPHLHLWNTMQCVDGQRVMMCWVEDVLAPYIALTPPGIIPIILLDSYRCHIMASVVNVIQGLGCEVVHIPGSWPLDVGYNKPFKMQFHTAWEEYMINDVR